MTPKYKATARRITSLMVGIPIVIVVGWDLWKRYDSTIRTKYDVASAKPSRSA
ncbi:hypothetical protein K458DRAFT_411554 [Lentithecium fluviatile CBS 122367]|uniref:Uncharacterized protein n=1 Tax=Lentithecium fluviatile CBS 122367 TaxID=1168545 RepID=A0A6G1JMT3_9PLEO|nr:hypothetical protein K458DRAFT_411554 [Lentithecium fluviatile CBS 122367]